MPALRGAEAVPCAPSRLEHGSHYRYIAPFPAFSLRRYGLTGYGEESRRTCEIEQTAVWRSPSLPGVEMTVGVNAGRRCRLLHESYAVCVVPYRGNASTVLTKWRYRGHDFVYRPGAIGVEEPGETHTCLRVYSPIRYCMLRLSPALVQEAAAEMTLGQVHFPSALSPRPGLYRLFSLFYASVVDDDTLLEQQTRLTDVLRALLSESRVPQPLAAPRVSQRSLERAREYLEAHVNEPVGLHELAGVADLSRFHLSRTFAQRFGLSPHAYQNQLRLRDVRERLRQGTRLHSIEAGFFDQSHMIRHFRDSMGMTPGEFARPRPLPPLD